VRVKYNYRENLILRIKRQLSRREISDIRVETATQKNWSGYLFTYTL